MISFNKEQIYIVTGASSGIGEGVSSLLNELGATVVAIGRDENRLDTAKAKCKYPENCFIEQKDLTEDIEELPQYVKSLKEKYGKFSGMVYCAGVSSLKPLQVLDCQEIKDMFDINYFAPVLMTKGLVDRRNNIGKSTSIVAISSIAALCCDKGHVSYAGSKAALYASMKAISKEVSGYGIRINCISPSNIKTPMTLNGGKGYEESQMNLYPFGFGEVSDVANMVIYLLSEKAKSISGQNYVVDGGGVL